MNGRGIPNLPGIQNAELANLNPPFKKVKVNVLARRSGSSLY
jgi:hypothetical protein